MLLTLCSIEIACQFTFEQSRWPRHKRTS